MPVKKKKKMLSIQNMRSIFLTGIKGTKNYFLVPNKRGDRKLDQHRPQGVYFCRRG